MQVILWIVTLTYIPVVACWWYVAVYYLRRLTRQPVHLEPLTGWPAGYPAPPVDIVLAAHNEAAGIEACLRGLLRQSYPNFRLIVASDRSSDATGAIVQRLAAADARIKLLEIRALPPGWTGKTHAVAQAARLATADYLLFIDSDVDLAPHALATVVHKACADGIDFLSLWPRLDLRSRSERLLTPAALVILSIWALPLVPRADVADQTQLGNGQFILIRRRAYEAIGGHAGVAAELAEDAVLAARAHTAGQRCWAGLGEGVYATHRTGGLRRTIHALARVFLGSMPQPRRLWAGTQVLLAGGFAPVWILPLALVLIASGGSGWLPWLLGSLAVLHGLGMMLGLHQAFRITLVRRGPLLWFPLGALLVAGVLVWSAYLLSGRGTLQWGPTRFRVRGSRVIPADA